ncbi:MAG: MBL fold metallo-hydrolase [Archaeoglobaceae archaeon]|nr:MBL fold metallo-hydrolase [Archaeoglobaceae archaeon]MCX8152717.1 MBL fold metallo-hydrolase [Archaeoglobaceae archaeon]MDW8013424.1 MBL fold metallo-hydrolase [Archaeoglobaceae archaeon]
MRIYILSDNKIVSPRPRGLKAEWGLSIYLDLDEPILLDCSQSDSAFNNMKVLKLKEPKKIVLSHGHYDHTGGLKNFLGKGVQIYAHSNAFFPRTFKGEEVGIPYSKEEIENFSKINVISEPFKIQKNVWILGEIPRTHEEALLEDSFMMGKPDRILDDTSIVVKTEKGLVLVLGCCHSGFRNTVKYAEEVLNDEVRFIVGGTHLIAFKDLREILEWIEKKEFELVAPCHCTGMLNEFLLKQRLGENCLIVGSGSKIEI